MVAANSKSGVFNRIYHMQALCRAIRIAYPGISFEAYLGNSFESLNSYQWSRRFEVSL